HRLVKQQRLRKLKRCRDIRDVARFAADTSGVIACIDPPLPAIVDRAFSGCAPPPNTSPIDEERAVSTDRAQINALAPGEFEEVPDCALTGLNGIEHEHL